MAAKKTAGSGGRKGASRRSSKAASTRKASGGRRKAARRGGPGGGPLLVGLALAVIAVLALLQVADRAPREVGEPQGSRADAPADASPAPARDASPTRRDDDASDAAASSPAAGARGAERTGRPAPEPTRTASAEAAPERDLPVPASAALPTRQLLDGSEPARVAIVIDDCGQRLDLMERAVRLPVPLTFAVIPHLPHSRASAELAARTGHEVIVHQPMEPEGHPAFDPAGAVVTGMGAHEIREVLRRSFEDVPHAVGMNNHMGSRATSSPVLMGHVLSFVSETDGPRGPLYFLDSRTSAETVALDTARRLGVPAARRHVFLDNEDDPVHVKAKLEELLATARRDGEAIGIGHLKPVTIGAIETMLSGLPANEYRLVFASSLVR